MRKLLTSIVACLLIAIFFLMIVGCNGSVKKNEVDKTYFTKYNFHYFLRGGKENMFASIVNYLNCPNHGFMPYNTEVKIGKYRKGFKLEAVKTGRTILVVAPEHYMGNKSQEEYFDLILSASPVSYTGLSEIDLKGVASGTPIEGMSKMGIVIALGYPAPAFTPSLESDVWHYWNSRSIKCNIYFTDGVVDRISKR